MSTHACQFCHREVPPLDDPAAVRAAEPLSFAMDVAGVWVCNDCYPRPYYDHWSDLELYELHYNFAVAFTDLDEPALALAAMQRALGIHETTDVLLLIANHYGETGQTDRQIATLERALRLDPKDFLARLNMAWALRDRGEWGQSLSLVDSLMKELGELPDLLMARAECLKHLGQDEEARRAYREARAAAGDEQDQRAFAARWEKLGDG